MTSMLRLVPILLAIASLSLGVESAAADTVDLALIVSNDVSRSIDDSEFELQRQGYAQAMTDPRVLAAIRSGRYHAL